MNEKLIIVSLGGSLIVPKGGIDFKFLKKFKQLIEASAKGGYKFVIVCGGGITARDYQKAAKKVSKLTRDDLDWLGIHATRLNSHLMRTIFRDIAHPAIVKNPTEKVNFKEKVLIGAGWKPGWSTDYDAVLLAKMYGAKKIINLTNIDYLHDKNPMIYNDAKKIKEIDWAGFRKIVGEKWDPGANTPFDPVATREAQKLGLELILANGKKINNLKKIIKGDKFIGSIVH